MWNIPERIRDALRFVASECAFLEDDWWIIGSTAALLIGLHDEMPRDIDLLVSGRDARRVFARWRVSPNPPSPSELFRSVFGVHSTGTVDIEIMGELEVATDGKWRRLEPKSRVPIETDAGRLFIPAGDEQIRILRLFGRPKDMLRADALVRLQEPA